MRHYRYLDVLRAGNRDDVLALREEPCEGDLAGRRVVFLADFADLGDEFEDAGEVLLRVPVVVCVEYRPRGGKPWLHTSVRPV